MSFSRGKRVGVRGDSACKKPFLRTEQGWLMYTLIKNHAGEAIFRTPSAQGVTIPEKCVIIGIAVRWRGRVAETQLKEDER
jgi:hypothetical protein